MKFHTFQLVSKIYKNNEKGEWIKECICQHYDAFLNWSACATRVFCYWHIIIIETAVRHRRRERESERVRKYKTKKCLQRNTLQLMNKCRLKIILHKGQTIARDKIKCNMLYIYYAPCCTFIHHMKMQTLVIIKRLKIMNTTELSMFPDYFLWKFVIIKIFLCAKKILSMFPY